MSDRLPPSVQKAVRLIAKEAELHEEVRLAREAAAYDLHKAGWPAARIADEFQARLVQLGLSGEQIKRIGVSRSSMDKAVRDHKIRRGEA